MMNKEVIKAYEAGKYSRIKQFISKKNQVDLIAVEQKLKKYFLIEKKFVDLGALDKELSIINQLKNDHGIKTVECFGRYQDVLLYEYVEGATLLELMEELESPTREANKNIILREDQKLLMLLKKTINYLDDFHKSTGLIFYDVNLRNFIVRENDIVAIDFEDARVADFSIDYGRLLAFILTYNPGFTFRKKEIVKELERYLKTDINIAFQDICDQKEKELISIRKRRGIS